MLSNLTSENPVALVTGGARRLGAGMVKALHAAGMNVIIHYLNSVVEAHSLQKELENIRAGSTFLINADLCDPATPGEIINKAIGYFGRLDVLVNNASSFYPTLLGETSIQQFDDLISTNVKAPYFLSQATASHLIATKGTIVNIADIYANRPLKSHSVYSATKAALVSLTQSLARELAPSVRVNAIAPGVILWPEGGESSEEQSLMVERTPLKRIGTPHDIQKALLFLVRDADFVTGQILYVDGGRSILA